MDIMIMDLNDVTKHRGMFLFKDEETLYLVDEKNYDRFLETKSSTTRMQLAEMVIDTEDGVVVKSRYF